MLQNLNHDRTWFIGGSDAKRIMQGDWLALYEEKLRIRQPEDLSNIFRVQLGKWTESFHAEWLVEQHGMQLTDPSGPVVHPEHDFLVGQLDRLWPEKGTFVELKHSNERANPYDVTETYLPQLAHYCNCMGVGFAYISTIPGNGDPFVTKVEPSREYMDKLTEMEVAFWWHVQNKVAPEIIPTATLARTNALAGDTLVDDFRCVDMTANNEWAVLAGNLIETKQAFDRHAHCKDELKALIGDDVGKASGHGVTIKRDKRGALRFTIKE